MREKLKAPAAVAGYVALYSLLAGLLACAFFEVLSHRAAIASYVVLGAIVLAAIGMNFESAIGLFRTRRAAAGMSVALAVASGLVILVGVNWISYRHYLSWDITEDKRFTLSEQTRKWLAELEERNQPLEIVTFLPYQPGRLSPLPPDYKSRITELLKLYELSPRVSVVNTDPDGDRPGTLAAAEKLGGRPETPPNETVVLKYGEKRKHVGVRDIFEARRPPYGGQRGEAVFKGEDAITSGLRDLLDEKPRRVYFVTGHGERTTGYDPGDYSTVVGRLRGMNFEIEELSLAEKGSVPDDADCLVIAGPTRPILGEEMKALESYLEGGGKLLAMLDYLNEKAGEKPSGLERVLAKYGVAVHQDAVALAPESAFLGARAIGRPDARHEISSPLARRQALFYRACVLRPVSPEKAGYETDVVVEGTERSWGEREPGRAQRYDAGDDVAGPTTLAVAVGPKSGMEAPENPAGIVVFSDADFVSNQLMADAAFRHSANSDLFLNAVNWMVGRRANIGIVPRERDRRTVVMTPSRRTKVFLGTVVFPAALMVALGIYVWRVRSR